jgi:ketosteroid isomerase-like protein
MSQENVEVVKAAYEAVVREWDVATAERLLDPAVEFHGTAGGLREGQVSRGLRQLRRDLHEEDMEVWEERRLEPQAFLDAGDRVVVLLHELRRGRGSRIVIEGDTAAIFDVRDGRVVRIQGYMNPAEALEAAGLRE